MVTVCSTVSALAPMYVAVTVTVGGAICGYCAIGSVGIVMSPTNTMKSEQTDAKIGRRRKYVTEPGGWRSTPGTPAYAF